MKIRKILLTSLFMALLGISTSSNASFFNFDWVYDYIYGVKIDDQGRRLHHHENAVGSGRGHTIDRHVGKSINELSQLCLWGINEGPDHATSYSDISNAAYATRDLIRIYQGYINGRASTYSDGATIGILHHPNSGNGYGVDCRLFSSIYYYNGNGSWGGISGTYTGPRSVPNGSRAVIKRNSTQKGRWYLLTAFPKAP